jgi:hypothetical protein
MSEYKIDKNVPLWKQARRAETYKYPFLDMETGDSFFFEGDDKKAKSVRASGHRMGVKVAFRREGNGYRCWRVE